MRRICTLLVALGFLFVFLGCQSMGVSVGAGKTGSSGGGGVVVSKPVPHARSDSGPGNGPPDHAPAHGRRAKYRYHYYLNINTYFDLDRKVYFYRRSGEWIISISLPSKVKISANEEYVEIELSTARPYEQHEEVIKKHPSTKPIKNKKNKKNKGI